MIIAILLSYQKIATIIDDLRFPPPGKLIDVGGCQLHLYSTGTGEPTVVLDAGLSGTSLGWSLVQQEVSKFARVCSYDRAGYAWSKEASSERTSLCLAEELHTLLHAANIPGPYVLVGHSFGGCNALLFADLYPAEVLGVILVDSVHEKMLQEFPNEPQSGVYKFIHHPYFQWLLSMLGYKRLKGPSAEIKHMFAPLPKEIRSMYFAQMNKTSYTKTVSKEMAALQESLSQLDGRKVHLQNKPLIVITAGQFSNRNEELAWNRLQKKLLAKSHRAKQIVASKSDHMINHHEPEIIVRAIQEMLNVDEK